MKAVIIDDMPLAIANLQQDLEDNFPEIELIGTADGVVSGAKLLKTLDPEILFLDINMDDGDGFDLLDLVQEKNFHVIFTTASEDYAIRAFQYSAADYLLKPVDTELLGKAIAKIKESNGISSDQVDIIKSNLSENDAHRIALNTQNEIRVLEFDEIQRCEAMDNYTRFFLSDGSKILVTKTLKEFEKTLPGTIFMRPHQSHLVNKTKIQSYIKTEGGYLLLKNGDRVPVSVRKKSEVMDALLNK